MGVKKLPLRPALGKVGISIFNFKFYCCEYIEL